MGTAHQSLFSFPAPAPHELFFGVHESGQTLPAELHALMECRFFYAHFSSLTSISFILFA